MHIKCRLIERMLPLWYDTASHKIKWSMPFISVYSNGQLYGNDWKHAHWCCQSTLVLISNFVYNWYSNCTTVTYLGMHHYRVHFFVSYFPLVSCSKFSICNSIRKISWVFDNFNEPFSHSFRFRTHLQFLACQNDILPFTVTQIESSWWSWCKLPLTKRRKKKKPASYQCVWVWAKYSHTISNFNRNLSHTTGF